MAFGEVAESYDRVRPGPAPGALSFLIPNGCSLAVDLAAGTGLFTRALAERVPEVVAVEPDPRMRGILAARSPGITVIEGRGEEMPLPDSSVDAVFVSTAWHWLDAAAAVPEIARVLRDGGRLGVLWTSRDRAEDWVAELDVLRLHGVSGAGEPRTVAGVREHMSHHHTVALPAGAPFANVATGSFGFTRTMRVDDVIDWLATNSALIAASPADREAGLARCRAALSERADERGRVEMPLRSWCYRADRLPRS